MANCILITTSSFAQHDKKPLDTLKQYQYQIVTNPAGRKLSEEEVLQLINEHEPVGIIAGVEPLTKNVLQSAKGLKVISRAGIGTDSVDLSAAESLGIVVTNTPDAPTIPVAELTLGAILALLRKIHQSDAAIRKHEWVRPMGNLLHNKHVGLIGCGRIGTYVAKLLRAFGCKISGCDPACKSHDLIHIIPLVELLSSSDIISLHLPYSEQTHHIINADRIALMKHDACLINASRGGLIDETALYDALLNGDLAGAALDTFEAEPYLGPLAALDNVLLTAHIGSYAKEGRALMEQQAVENLLTNLKISGEK